jgi:hypothetical protein
MKYYTYRQNNSGGTWEIDESKGIGHYVIIFADDAQDADYIAERIGIEFYTGCPCCGDRWTKQLDDTEGKDIPMIYDKNLEEALKDKWIAKKGKSIFLHFNKKEFMKITEENAKNSCKTNQKSLI